MITETAKHRAQILTFWKKHGCEATEEAYGVKERTLYLWQKKLKGDRGKLESLNSGSCAPKNKRKRRYDWRIVEEIKRLRDTHPNLGEKKFYPLLLEFCTSNALYCPKPATIGRIIKDKGGMRIVPQRITGTGRIVTANRRKILRKPKGIKAEHPGHIIAPDCSYKTLVMSLNRVLQNLGRFIGFFLAWNRRRARLVKHTDATAIPARLVKHAYLNSNGGTLYCYTCSHARYV